MSSTRPIIVSLPAVRSCDLDLGDRLETVVARERLYPERRPATDPSAVAIDLRDQVGQAIRDLVHVMVVGRADHVIERPDNSSHALEVAQRLLDACEQVDAGEARRLVTLLCGQGVAEPPDIPAFAVALGQ